MKMQKIFYGQSKRLRGGIELTAVNQTIQTTQNLDSANIAARAESASKIYGSGESEVRALDNVSVTFERGKFSALLASMH
jgi:hypothetical protein